jgi:lipoprotein-anchoring transpeptidase ErfK/SrfK
LGFVYLPIQIMKFAGISVFTALLYINIAVVASVFHRIPEEVPVTDYVFVVDIQDQTNYLFYKQTLVDQFSVSTGSKTRYKGDRTMPEGVWRLGQRMATGLAPIYGARLIYLEKYHSQKKQFFKTNKAFHGTNEPHLIGQPTSMGCVYHFDDDIVGIYSHIPDHSLVITVQSMGDP